MAEQAKDETMKYVVIFGGAILLWDKIFGKTEQEKAAAKQEQILTQVPQDKNPTLENYKLPPKKGYAIYRKNAGSILGNAAREIREAIGHGHFVNSSKILAQMKRAVTKTEVNILFRSYNTIFKRDLLNDLKVNMPAGGLSQVLEYINTLPNYIKVAK